MSWQKGTTFGALDSVVIDDETPASAHLLRAMARSANYLGASPRNLLQIAADRYGLDGFPRYTVITRPGGPHLVDRFPIFKPANVRDATVHILGGWGDTTTPLFRLRTSQGSYDYSELGAGDMAIEIPVEFGPARTDFLELRIGGAGAYNVPSSYGDPQSGTTEDLVVASDNHRIIQLPGASSPSWETVAPTYATSGHVIQFYDGSDIYGQYFISAVVLASVFHTSAPVPVAARNDGTFFPAYYGTSWAVRKPTTVVLHSLNVIADEVSP